MPAIAGIRQVAESYVEGRTTEAEISEGLIQAADTIVDMVEAREITPEDACHTGVLFDTFCNRGAFREKYGPQGAAQASAKEITEAMVSSEFPKITGTLIHMKLIPAYEAETKNLNILYDEVESDKREETHAGIIDLDEPESLEEGQQYDLATLKEKDIKITNQKVGHAIALTREIVAFDRTGGEILTRARNHGDSMGNHHRRWVMQGIQDIAITATGQAANTMLNYKDTTYALYANTHSTTDGQINDNLLSGASSAMSVAQGQGALASADTLLGLMKDFWGNELNITGEVLLVPRTLKVAAHNVVNAVGDPSSASLRTNWINDMGAVQALWSDPVLDTTSATAWYYGNFKRQFRWQWVRRPFIEEAPGIPLRDIVLIFKSGYHAGFGAMDYRFVIRSAGA